MSLNQEKINEFIKISNNIRINIIKMLYEAQSGHTAGALGMADIFTLLYFHILKHDPQKPDWELRDRLVLSNGHICPVLYATMGHAGYFPKEYFKTLRKFNSKLQGHPHREYLKSLETSSGPLGSGLSQSVGMALASKINMGLNISIYCIVGDGELDEGQNWEAIMLANKYKLSNLIVIVDRNNIQIDGNTESVMPLNNLRDKWNAFGWHTEEVDGHDFVALEKTFDNLKHINDKPKVIIANTIPGKGVKKFENNYKWHGKAPNKEEMEEALKELKD